MTARRANRPVTVAIAQLEPWIRDRLNFTFWDVLQAERPTTVRVWRRQDGVTVRAASRTPDGMRISSVVKLRRR